MTSIIALENLISENEERVKLQRRQSAEHESGVNKLSRMVKAATETHLDESVELLAKFQFMLEELLKQDQEELEEKQKIERQLQKTSSGGVNSVSHNLFEIENLWNVLTLRVSRSLETAIRDLHHKVEVLEKVDPTKLFAKGYTISTIEGTDLNKYDGDMNGKILISYSDKNEIESVIQKIKKR